MAEEGASMTIIDHPAALGNFRRGRRGRIALLVIHVMQGTFDGTAKWFGTADAQVSYHYGVSVDGLVCRYVLDEDTAFGCGNRDINSVSLSIGLEGDVDDPDAFTDKMMAAAEQLCADLCSAHGLPVDRAHIIGHHEVPDPRNPKRLGGWKHHTDPGPYFPWEAFLAGLTRALPRVA